MIHFLFPEGHDVTLKPFLRSWGRALAPRVRIHSWDEVSKAARLPAGTWVFGDFSTFPPAEAERAARVWRRIERSTQPVRLLNHPLRTRARYELLRALCEQGVNEFDVYRLTEARTPRRFPVFLRPEGEAGGPKAELLESPQALAGAIADLEARDRSREGRLIVEFAAERDARGHYRTYAALNAGGRIVPWHLLSGPDWIVKRRGDLSPEALEREMQYLETNPHEKELLRLFEIANIDWGRIDYGLVGGRIQVYEIEKNPFLMDAQAVDDPGRRHRKETQARLLCEALEALDTPADPRRRPVWIAHPSRLRRAAWLLRARLRRLGGGS